MIFGIITWCLVTGLVTYLAYNWGYHKGYIEACDKMDHVIKNFKDK